MSDKRTHARRPREPWIERLLDLAAGWLLAASMCMVVDAQFPIQSGLLTVLWQTAAVLAALTLLTLRWWVLPSALGAGLLTTFFILLPMEELKAALLTVKEFFLWWFSNLPMNSPWYTPRTMYILHSLIHLGVAVLVFVLLRLFRRSWPLVMLGGALQVFILLVASKDNSALSLGLYLSGVFPLLARDRYSGRRTFSHRQRYTASTPRWKLSLACGFLCIATTVAMMFALPADTSEIRLRPAANGVADLQTVTDWYLADQKENTALTLHQMGLQPNKFRLGGDLVKPESAVLATTDLTEKTLVKVTAFDTFDGKKWSNEFTTGYRVNGPWKNTQADYLASPILVDDQWAAEMAALGLEKDVTFTLQAPLFLLPSVGQTLAVKENTYEKSTLSYNERGELLTFTYPMKAGYSYTVTTLDIPLENNLPAAAYQAAATVALAKDDPLLASDAFFDRYTAVPDGISYDVRQATWDLTDGVPTKLEQVLMISRFFSLDAGYVYEEAPGKTASNDNVVDQVFRTKKGYCVHYATAMATMTRLIGIPTRLAAGYQTVTGEDGKQVVDAARPYVWVECYFKNLGWLSFDPTPGEGFRKPQQDKPQEMPPTDSTPTPPSDPDESTDEDESANPMWLLWVLLLLVAAMVTARAMLSDWHYRLPTVRRRYPSLRRQAMHYYRDILRQLRLLGYPLRRGDTLYELTARFDEKEKQLVPPSVSEQTAAYRAALREMKNEPSTYRPDASLEERLREKTLPPALRQTVADVTRRLRPVMELVYAGREPTPEQIEALYALRGELEDALLVRLNPFAYIFHRRLLLPPFSFVTLRYK